MCLFGMIRTGALGFIYTVMFQNCFSRTTESTFEVVLISYMLVYVSCIYFFVVIPHIYCGLSVDETHWHRSRECPSEKTATNSVIDSTVSHRVFITSVCARVCACPCVCLWERERQGESKRVMYTLLIRLKETIRKSSNKIWNFSKNIFSHHYVYYCSFCLNLMQFLPLPLEENPVYV